MGVLKGCKPRTEVLTGELDDAIFAAEFGDLLTGRAPGVYGEAKQFFLNTHPAKQLKKVTEVVFARLANSKEGGATVRLSTGFGGGKSHTLMAFWHLAKNIDDPGLGHELLPAAGRPKKVKPVGVDCGKAGVPEFSFREGRRVHSLWGDLFFQLGGTKALTALGAADDPEGSPNEAQIEKAFPTGPVLILLDELVVYMAKLSEQGQGNFLGFLNSLASVVTKRPQTVLVVTDPADQRVYAKEAAKLGDAITAAAVRLDDMFGRKMTDFDPIGDESAKVITRRLFKEVDQTAAQAASAAYHSLYKRVAQELPGSLPASAATAAFAQQIVECYPFHPRLLESARDRLGALQDFHKSRGVLRLFARILREVWDTNDDVDLISAGEIDWSSPRIQADLLQRLNRDQFRAAVSADVQKHAGELDGDRPRGIHRRVASALLLESLPLQPNSGLDAAELTLAVLRPDEAGPEPEEALGRLAGVCWHTYPLAGGRGWQFRYEPNVVKQIEERMGKVPIEDAKSRVFAEVQGYFSGPTFRLVPWPSSARQVPESGDLQLVLCEDEKLALWVCQYGDDTNHEAPMPRRFQNAILAVTATPSAFSNAIERAQRLLAAQLIEQEHGKSETGKLMREQLGRIKPELNKHFRLQACRAFDVVVLPGIGPRRVEEQYQVPDEQVLQSAQGQKGLRRFLEEKRLVYQAGDALDVDLFVREVLPGATPVTGKPEVFTAKSVHERFLGAPKLRLIPDGSVVRNTLIKALAEGKLVIHTADGAAYDAKGSVRGPEGHRKRQEGRPASLPLDDTVLVALAKSPTAVEWLRESAKSGETPEKGIIPPPPPEPSHATATTWEEAIEFAGARPLEALHLVASTPPDAMSLLSLAQPLGADRLSLEVTVSGDLKDGGSVNFSIAGVKPTHQAKPLTLAQTLFNALADGGTYEADLCLEFTGAREAVSLQDRLRSARDGAPGAVSIRVEFGKPVGGSP